MSVRKNLFFIKFLFYFFKAYQKWAQNNKNIDKKLPGLTKYSPEQMFFINYGQVWCSKVTNQYAKNAILRDFHSPPDFRFILLLTNFYLNSSDFLFQSNWSNIEFC